MADEEGFDDDPGDHCGMLSDGTCQLAGTEWCDWECPYNQTVEHTPEDSE